MNVVAYMSITGSRQGLISQNAFTPDSLGNRYQEGHEDEIFIETYSYGSSVPTDENGFIKGTRQHQSLNIVKPIDSASPLLFEALNKGETLSNIELKLYRTSYEGKPEQFFTITLTDAIITSIQTMDNQEDIDFRYRRIELRHEVSSTSSSDDLRTGVKST